MAWSKVILAAESTTVSPSSGLLKMVLGLVVVLAVMAGLAWILKRLLPGANRANSVVRIVGGVSVGSRERVVVIEVGGRWIVVGVAPGSVNSLANLDAVHVESIQDETSNQLGPQDKHNAVEKFPNWLKKSLNKLTEKSDVQK